MKKFDLYVMAIRLMGLYMLQYLLDSILQIIYNMQFLLHAGEEDAGLLNIKSFMYFAFTDSISALFLLLLLFVFILKPAWLVKRLCNDEDLAAEIQWSSNAKTVYEATMRISGLVLLMWTLPEFIVKFKSYNEFINEHPTALNPNSDKLWTYGLKMFIAIVLILAADSLSGFFVKKSKTSEENPA